MLANRKRLLHDPNLVGRIDSEHLSEQFQRELSNSPGDDFLHDDLKLDDISNASGSGVAALAQTTQPQQVTRPDMLASVDVSDDNWLVASPLPSPIPTPSTRQNRFYDADRQLDNRGAILNGAATNLERSPSTALSKAYAQPSKIPRLNQATSTAAPQQLAPRGASKRPDPATTSAMTRQRSGAGMNFRAASPSPSKSSVGLKPPYASPARSTSDGCEDGQPEWRSVSKPPAPKYTQQTDIALGGPFQRSGSSQLFRANSTQQSRPVSRPTSRPTSVKAARLQEVEARTHPQQAVLRSQPSIPQFQSKIPVAPPQHGDAGPPSADAAKPSGSYANDGRFASGFAQVSNPVEQPQPAAVAEQSAAVAQDPGSPAEATARAVAHMNGTAQHAEDTEAQEGNVSKAQAHSQPPVSSDHVHLAMPGLQPQPGGAVQPDRSSQGPQHTEEMQKVKKCCCCAIM